MDEPLQKSLERYDVLDRIAIGGMAEVFLAKAYGAHGFEKTLAIKKILPELASDPEFAARFIAEAKVAVKLSHANVVQVFDFGRIGESLFIAMEYVDGLDLAALLRKYKDEKRLVPLPAAFHIAIEIIRALDFAHGHNVVHRDVSPSNILISRAGEVKIGDFGIAVAASPHKSAGPGIRKVMGKWRYMSPEQARGDTLDTRSDMFSAASVLFELFTGEKLFPGDEAEAIIKNIETMVIPKASSLRPGLPSRLDEILAGPLSRKPVDRPTRPATVLRSLIELSYESSIMATALDVAECVATVIPAKRTSGPGQHLDDVIRKQLGSQQDKSVARRTAVTDGKPPSTATIERGEVSTGMFRKIDMDGISRLEEVDNPTEVAAPRARRASEEMHATSADSGLHKLLDARRDPDRRTEVGGPPTGQVPKLEDVLDDGRAKSTTESVTVGSRKGLVIALSLGALAIGGVGMWLATHAGDDLHPIAHLDGGVAQVPTTLDLDSVPSGATLTVDDKVIGKGPQVVQVTSNVEVRLKIELKGYLPYEEKAIAQPSERLKIRPTLTPAPATLTVDTTPQGAQVVFGSQSLGDTPVKKDLSAQTGELSITKAGFEPFKASIELVAGESLAIKHDLKELPKYGIVMLDVQVAGHKTWAEVFSKGKSLGRNSSLSGLRPLRLPVGRQALHLENKDTHKSKDVTLDVSEGSQTKQVSLD